jgi:ribose transport system permease protein
MTDVDMAARAVPRRALIDAIPVDRLFLIASRVTALVLLVVVLSIVSSHFLSLGNITNVLRQAALQFLMSAGLTIVVLTGGIDLSIGAVLGLSAVFGASLIVSGHVMAGIGAALLIGLACGVVNGSLVAYLRIPPFIATYGMLWIALGLGFVFMRGEVIYGFPTDFRFIGAGFVGPIPFPIILGLIVLAVLFVGLKYTTLGRSFYAIGGNVNAARLSGMPVRFRTMCAYAISGLLAGFAGLVVIARTGAVDAGVGEELLLPTIAAVVLGGTSLMGGVGGVIGTAIGAIIISVIINGMNLLGVNTSWQWGVLGALILVAVLSDELIARRIRDRV